MTKMANRVSINCVSRSWKKMIAFGLIVILSLLPLSGCQLMRGSLPQTPGTEGNVKTLQVALVTAEEGIQDPNFQKAWEGLQKAEKELNVGITYVKAKNEKDYKSNLAQLSNKKLDVIFTRGAVSIPAVLEAAKNNPKIKYICLDTVLEEPIPANVLGVTSKVEEASFLAGYLAGKMTKSRVVGFISGDNKEEALRYYYGYKAGLRYANPGCELMKGIAGTFTNKTRLEVMTERMVASKADVVFHVSGTAGKSVIKVMDKHGKYAIGSLVDQNNLAPKMVITSVIKNDDQILFELIKKTKDKQLVLGKNLSYGLAENGVGLAETTEEQIPENVYQQLMQNQEKIISGKMIIPSTEDAYLKFTKN